MRIVETRETWKKNVCESRGKSDLVRPVGILKFFEGQFNSGESTGPDKSLERS